MAVVVALLQGMLLLNGCGVTKKGGTDRFDGNWKIAKMSGHEIMRKSASDDVMTFSFDFEEMQAGGFGFCNSYGASFTLDKSTGICTFGPVFSTRVGCEGNNAESVLSQLLQKTKLIVRKGNNLLFYDNTKAQGTPLLEMELVKGTKQSTIK